MKHHVGMPARGRNRVSELTVMMGRLAQQAKAAGQVTLARTSLVVNCPIVP